MSPEAWTFFSVLTTVSGGTLAAVVRRDRRAAAADADQDEDADHDDPATVTSERRFRLAVLKGLAELKAVQADQGRRLDRHLSDHASSDLRRP